MTGAVDGGRGSDPPLTPEGPPPEDASERAPEIGIEPPADRVGVDGDGSSPHGGLVEPPD